MFTSAVYGALAFATLVSAAPAFNNLVIHEQRSSAPDGFVNNGVAPSDQVLNLRIALVNSDIAELEEKLYAVSTPGSALYGQHLSKEQFLASYGVSASVSSPAGDWMSFSVPVSKANEMFDANFSVFQHSETGITSVRTLEYSIPTELQGHLSLVHPTITFDSPSARLPIISGSLNTVNSSKNHTSRAAPSSCNSTVTPACLQALYGIPTKKATQSSSTLGVSGFEDEFANLADLQTFLKALRPDLVGTTFTLQTLDGGSNNQSASSAGTEANLDIQYTVGLASGVPTTFISVGDQNSNGILGAFLDIINFLLSESNPPHVLTTSYGTNEDTVSSALANQLCNAYMQLGARGTSILFASGDGGVAGLHPSSCTAFLPTFPSGCPYLTSIATTGTSETAASFSGGGFSNIFARPSYQSAAVASYLAVLGSTNSGDFNSTGRAYPDVSAQGVNVEIVVNRQTGPVSGTSCSSPIFASVVALLNDQLVAAGKSPLGFLNPFLYSSAGAAALNDVTSGSNPGCNTNGFPAIAGWDPVTGLGTPNFAKLLAAAGL